MSITYAVTSTKDIKRALEQHFQWRGFSVTKKANSRYVSIRWTNGPTHEQVSKLTGRWNDSKNDDSGGGADLIEKYIADLESRIDQIREAGELLERDRTEGFDLPTPEAELSHAWALIDALILKIKKAAK